MTPYDPPKPAGRNPAAHSGFLRNTGRSNSPEVSPCLSRILRKARVALSPRLARHSRAQRATYRDKAKAHDEAPNHDTDDDSGARQTYARRMG